ncbi:MAG: PhzF family phenazine biosynthesis protein [Alphaproteobacteria bacterium]|nr:PhzF family phenazine biosynthesis protein [Alphaproteobacteria bacterium]
MFKAPVRYFDCFTSEPGGGNTVAIVTDASGMHANAMQAAASDIGAPATCFLECVRADCVHARFFSPRSEYKMCGHAVIGLFTMLVQDHSIAPRAQLSLATPGRLSPVYVEILGKEPPRVMLDLPLPTFQSSGVKSTEITKLLKIPLQALSMPYPMQVAEADFMQLLVPVAGPEELARIVPNFADIAAFCQAMQIDSVAAFTPPTHSVPNTYEIREFCPAIGVDESAAAGTTNATVSCYLAAQGALTVHDQITVHTTAHQGAEVGRPSVIHSEIRFDAAQIVGVRTGGTAIETSRFS